MKGFMKGLKSKLPSAKTVAQPTRGAKIVPPMRPPDVSHEQFYGSLLKNKKIEKTGGDMFALGFEKEANVLTTKARKKIKDENFALPGRRYPIENLAHGRNAIARVMQHGTPEEQAEVKRKVYAKYPALKERHEERQGE